MGRCVAQVEEPMSATIPYASTLAKPIAAEDLRPGDYVALLVEAVELPSFLWGCESVTLAPDEPVQVCYRPLESGLPLKVKALCLPFVFVRRPCGHSLTLDVRACRLARLQPGYGCRVTKRLKKERKGKRRRSRCCSGLCF